MMNKPQQNGFTLVELLIGLAVLGILIGSFFRLVGNTVDTSTELSVRNEVVQDAQIAQQIINARLQEACFVYTSGTIQMASSGWTTQRSILGLSGYIWNITNNDPIVAMILPPDPNDVTAANRPRYRFLAYYPVRRGAYIAGNVSTSNNISQLPTEPANDNNWVLMQYIRYLPTSPGDTTAPVMNPSLTCTVNVTNGNASITGGAADLLVDYVQPTNVATTYSMFDEIPAAGSVPPNITFRLRMLRTYRGSATIRVPGASEPPMQVTTAPQNHGL